MPRLIVPIEYPSPPAKLLEPPVQLEKIPDGTEKIEDVTKIIIKNYSIYHREALKLELLQDWTKSMNELSKGINGK